MADCSSREAGTASCACGALPKNVEMAPPCPIPSTSTRSIFPKQKFSARRAYFSRRKRHFFLDGQFGPDNFPASEKLNGNLFAEGDPMRAIKLLSIAAFLLAVTLLAGRLVTAGSEPPQK